MVIGSGLSRKSQNGTRTFYEDARGLSDDEDTGEMSKDSERLERSKVLLENGAVLGIRECCGSTPLELAKEKGFSELAELLSTDPWDEGFKDVELVDWESP